MQEPEYESKHKGGEKALKVLVVHSGHKPFTGHWAFIAQVVRM